MQKKKQKIRTGFSGSGFSGGKNLVTNLWRFYYDRKNEKEVC